MRRLRVGVAATVPLLLFCGRALGQANYQNYLVGERAAAMGGAYTALADDASGAYYNPAGTAFSAGSSISASANLYGYVTTTQQDALGAGRDVSSRGFNPIPSSVGSLFKVGEPAPYGRPITLGFQVFAPNSFTRDTELLTTDAAGRDLALSERINWNVMFLGPTAAYRMSEGLSVGAGAYLQYASYSFRQASLTADAAGTSAQRWRLWELDSFGVVGNLGVNYRDGMLHVGASVWSPTIELAGDSTRTSYCTAIASGPCSATAPSSRTSERGKARFLEPLHGTLGVAIAEHRSFAVALDVSLYAPVKFDLVDLAGTPHIDNHVTVNANVGGELYVTRKIPLRLGFWTNLSANREPSVSSPQNRVEAIDFYGISAGSGYLSDKGATTVGFNYAFGNGTVLRDAGVTKTSGQMLLFLLATSYTF